MSGVQGNQTPVVYSQSDRAQGGRSRRMRRSFRKEMVEEKTGEQEAGEEQGEQK